LKKQNIFAFVYLEHGYRVLPKARFWLFASQTMLWTNFLKKFALFASKILFAWEEDAVAISLSNSHSGNWENRKGNRELCARKDMAIWKVQNDFKSCLECIWSPRLAISFCGKQLYVINVRHLKLHKAHISESLKVKQKSLFRKKKIKEKFSEITVKCQWLLRQ